jgi:hypothetical protein
MPAQRVPAIAVSRLITSQSYAVSAILVKVYLLLGCRVPAHFYATPNYRDTADDRNEDRAGVADLLNEVHGIASKNFSVLEPLG